MHTTSPTQPDRARAELRALVAGLLDASDAYEFEPSVSRRRRAEELAAVIVDALAPTDTR